MDSGKPSCVSEYRHKVLQKVFEAKCEIILIFVVTLFRRFISFGVIKGFLYRVHKYPVLPEPHHQRSKLPAQLRR